MSNIRQVIIEYLDLNQSDRCIGTDDVLDEVVKTLTPTLQMAGYDVILRKIEMSTPELAT